MPHFNYEKFRQLPLPTEEEVTANWSGSFARPVVSIVCITYNQQLYIEDAIRGFLIQETVFPFEVLIHDDASTDDTAAIVRKYQSRYPNIIRAIVQYENQYSKGVKVTSLVSSLANGKYLALCEGDDFWIDKRKLAIQVQALRSNPNHKICFHRCLDSSSGIDGLKKKVRDFLWYPRRPCVVSANVVAVGDGGYVPTASLMVDRLSYSNFPQWYDDCPVGDYFLQVLCADPLGAIFVPQRMCFYRVFSVGSWSSKATLQSADERLKRFVTMKSCLEMLGNYVKSDCTAELRDVYDLSVLNCFRNRVSFNVEKQALLELYSDSKGKQILSYLLGQGLGESLVFECALLSIYVINKSRQFFKIFMSHAAGGKRG